MSDPNLTDPQASAFRDASELDWPTHELVDHPESNLADLEPEPHMTREDYEAQGWDVDAQPAKTRDQARDALAARIDDPSAPDTQHEGGAYDDADPDGDSDDAGGPPGA